MFGHWCSNQLADLPYHFGMMNVIVAVKIDQVQLMSLNNEMHHSMHEHVAMMVNFADEAKIVHLSVMDYFHCLLIHLKYHSIYCRLLFDLMMIVVVVVVVGEVKYF